MGKELVGVLMAAGGKERGEFEKQIAKLQTMSPEEKVKHMIVKGLDEGYRNRTFREVAEYMIKDTNTLEPEQKMIADKVKSFFIQHLPPEFICNFRAYNVDGSGASTELMNNHGQPEIDMNDGISKYITSRQEGCREYDCIDMMCVGTTGLGARTGKAD